MRRATASACSAGGRLDHDPDQLLGAGRAQQDATGAVQRGLGFGHGRLDRRGDHRGGPVGHLSR